MMTRNYLDYLALTAAAVLAASGPAFAAGSNSGEVKGSHPTMSEADAANKATAKAVIHSVDVQGGSINVTHEPIPTIGWPTMTMDIPVTRRVDLASVKPGSAVVITLKKGRDKQYRVIEIQPVTN